MSTRTTQLLRRIPGFDQDQEEIVYENEQSETISQSVIDDLARLGVQINDIIVTEDEISGLQVPYLKMEDERNSPFYVLVDVENQGISAKPGTPIYVVSSVAASAPFSLKTMSLSNRTGAVYGSVIECDADGLCFLTGKNSEPEESYLRTKSSKQDEERPRNVSVVVSLKDLIADPKTVLSDIKRSNKKIQESIKNSCLDKISRNTESLIELQNSFNRLTGAIQNRFQTLEISAKILEDKIEFFNRNPDERFKDQYHLAAKELDIRRDQYDQVVGFCETALNDIFVLFNNVDKQIKESTNALDYDNNTYNRLYSVSTV